MSQTTHRDFEGLGGNEQGLRYPQIRPVPRDLTFGDGSEPLFSIYSKAAGEEDINVVERCQKDASILIFVSFCVRIHIVP
jgi:hypothetical protein